jgi:hypothetical protein
MAKLTILFAALGAAAVLTAPALARESHPSARQVAEAAPTIAPDARYVDGRLCIPAPRVGAFATAPWTNDTPCEPAYYGSYGAYYGY